MGPSPTMHASLQIKVGWIIASGGGLWGSNKVKLTLEHELYDRLGFGGALGVGE